MSLFPPTKTPAPLPGSAVLPKEKGRFIFVRFTPVSVPVLAQGFLQLALDVHQTFQQQGVEGPALAVQDHLHGLFVRVGFFIAALMVPAGDLLLLLRQLLRVLGLSLRAGPAHGCLNNEKGISHIFVAVL